MWFKRKSDVIPLPAVLQKSEMFRIVVCRGPTCSERNATGILTTVEHALAARVLQDRVQVFTVSCFGHCSSGPNMVVGPRREGWDPILGEAQYFIGEEDEYLYHRLTSVAVEEVIDEHIVHGRPVRRLLENLSGSG